MNWPECLVFCAGVAFAAGAGMLACSLGYCSRAAVAPPINPIDMPNFLHPSECAELIAHAEHSITSASSISVGNSYWNSRVVYPDGIAPDVLHRLRQLTLDIAHMIRRHYQLEPWIQVYLDTLVLARMKQGDGVDWHADNAFFPDCKPNYVDFRTWSAVVYLNGHDGVRGVASEPSFTGGLFQFYARRNETIVPHAGRLLAFGAGCDYFHRALPVESGTRYTIALWFTDRLEKANPHFHGAGAPPLTSVAPLSRKVNE